jgi:hypothetical protein
MAHSRARAHFILCGALLSAGFFSTPSFAVTDAERAGARAAANQGADAFDQSKWAEAIELFTRAEALVHSPIHLSYIARAQLKLGHWVEAYELFNRIKREPLEAPVSAPAANAVADANRQLSALDAQLPYITLIVKGTDTQGVTVTMDGAAVPSALIGVSHPVNPGPHKFRAASATQASSEQTVEIKPAARQTVELVLAPTAAAVAPVAPVVVAAPAAVSPAPEPPPAPTSSSSGSGMRVGGYVALGVGVVGVGLGTVFLLSSSSKQKDADAAFDACGGAACSVADRDKVDALDSDAATGKTLALTSFIVGGVGLATGVTLLVLSGKQKSAEPAALLKPRVEPWIGYGSLGLRGTF